MKRKGYLLILSLLLSGCFNSDSSKELNNYYISMTKSGQHGENVYFQNNTFDFETGNLEESEVKSRTSQYPVVIFDKEYNRYIYSAKEKRGYDDHIFVFDNKSNEEIHIDLGIWGVNYILSREKDYIVVGVKNKTHRFGLFSIDKKTLKSTELKLPTDFAKDLSVWQVAYVPQTDELILQVESESDSYERIDKWNKDDDREVSEPWCMYYHYLMKNDNTFEFLFEMEMACSLGIISNGKDVLIERFSNYEDLKGVYRFNIENKKLEKEENVENLDRSFYLDNEGRYLYELGNKIMQIDTQTKEHKNLDIEFPFHGYMSNFIIVRK